MFGEDIGIDLGTSNVLIYLKGQGVVLNEPSLVAFDKEINKVISIGKNAKDMLGKAPSNIQIIQPLKHGIISDYNIAEIMLKFFIEKAIHKTKIRRPKIAVCVPCNITLVEKKAVEDATKDAGAREVFIIEEPLAAAIGAGIDIFKPCGNMIIDIGAGTTNIAVISLGGIVASVSSKIAGNQLDEDIIKYVRKKYNIIIGEKTAEQIKIEIGTAYKGNRNEQMEIRGQNLITSLPGAIKITSDEVFEAIKESIFMLIKELCFIFEKVPPELSADIYETGITLTGGGVKLDGLGKIIEENVKVKTNLSKEAKYCVVLGTGEYIKYVSSIKTSEESALKRNKILNFKWR